MGTLRVTSMDKNRYSKRYPLIKAPVRMTFVTDKEIGVEVGSIYFDNTNTGTFIFDVQFSDSNVQVFAIARKSDNEISDVNVFVQSVSAGSVTIESSSNFTGYVDIFAVRIG